MSKAPPCPQRTSWPPERLNENWPAVSSWGPPAAATWVRAHARSGTHTHTHRHRAHTLHTHAQAPYTQAHGAHVTHVCTGTQDTCVHRTYHMHTSAQDIECTCAHSTLITCTRTHRTRHMNACTAHIICTRVQGHITCTHVHRTHHMHRTHAHVYTGHRLHAHVCTGHITCTHVRKHRTQTGTCVHTQVCSQDACGALSSGGFSCWPGGGHLLEEGVACGSETLGRGTVRRGSKEQPLLLREDTGWRKLVAHRTFWHVETGWAHFGEGTWRLGSEGDILCIFRCFALF